MSQAFLEAEQKLFAEQAREVDIIITTALIPGKPAPILLPVEVVESMRPGSVIVDLAAEFGGNCAVTKPGEVIEHKGVTVIGFVDLPSRLAPTASQLYGSNLVHLLADMGGAKSWHVDLDDEVVRGALVLLEGELMWPPPRKPAPPVTVKPPPLTGPLSQRATEAPRGKSSAPAPSHTATTPREEAKHAQQRDRATWLVLLLAAMLAALGFVVPAGFLTHLTVFVLACFVGWQVVWNVTAALHTPLMSVTNAISGIILVGGMLQIGSELTAAPTVLGALAVLLATINIAGGFLVTQRMLQMFRR
jgi:NAD(P) transhydrogenase subunit alpha